MCSHSKSRETNPLSNTVSSEHSSHERAVNTVVQLESKKNFHCFLVFYTDSAIRFGTVLLNSESVISSEAVPLDSGQCH